MGGPCESFPLLGPPGAQLAWAPQLHAAMSGGMIAMMIGTTVSLPSILIPWLVAEGLARDLGEAAVLATSYLYSAVPACLLGGLLSDWLGRRRTALRVTLAWASKLRTRSRSWSRSSSAPPHCAR